jgi:hypothetical protein
MASFALPNMLPNSPSHSSFRFPSLLFIVLIPRLLSLVVLYANAQPFLTNIPQQLQAFQLQIQQQSNQPQRKSLFSPYLPAASLPQQEEPIRCLHLDRSPRCRHLHLWIPRPKPSVGRRYRRCRAA